MKTLRANSLLCLGLLTLWGISTAQAANISGTYSDKGTLLSGASPQVSFHALLGLEFMPEVGMADRAATTYFELTDRDNWLEIKTLTADRSQISRSRWGPENGFTHEDGAAVFRISKNRDEFYTFIMKSAADGEAVELRVYKVKPSVLGPRADPIETYYFVKAYP
jgi:hypothetical protein